MSSAGPLKQMIRQFIDEIKAVSGVNDCALVSTDGILIGKSFEDSLSAQSFGAMCATMIASSEAAASVVNIESTLWIVVKSPKQSIVLVPAGERLLIAVTADNDANLEGVCARLREIGERIGGAL
ncbi:MAG: Roadblock/LC7 family protein [Methanomicrobiales archaeon 53_19]|uniref:roadblock/LC7 domain-containing protein n=1 Tax=Methanocalculus sp. TaxID=2004547 RepID=UPI0007461832|nr:roadblock/LC7 domain-containing protein [Methanocalculus sp.]KUK69378.1 MAG: Roadblock/LC7 family protein [Methanocalculus sp. 52_23]KUL04051.1 MAG: Roadblock/LC7 family protein [Methanomicrobiales archaeon 53_19]HIJ06794.1 roadblock/LC7 domain-containing protein [Methanocalculus sp.]